MSWASLLPSDWPTDRDYADAIATGELTGDGPPPETIADVWLTSTLVEGIIDLSSSLPAPESRWPTKAEVLARRTYDPADVVPHSWNAQSASPIGGVLVTWTDDGDIPSGWASDETEWVIERSVQGSGTWSEVATGDVSPGQSRQWADGAGSVGTTYCYRGRYRSKSDSSRVGAWTSSACALYADSSTA